MVNLLQPLTNRKGLFDKQVKGEAPFFVVENPG
jgi:hypothetical protein